MLRANTEQKSREICECGRRPVVINYKKDDITHYRSVCSTCSKKRRKQRKNNFPNYTKKKSCEKCGFNALYTGQLDIFTVQNPPMLKTVCLNCKEELMHTNVWNQGDLVADF
jgi:hypothetical protein